MAGTTPIWIVYASGVFTDGDGVDDFTESNAPNNGDGNNDGIPDANQPNVSSFPSAAGSYVTFKAPNGVVLQNVETIAAVANPVNAPPGWTPPPANYSLPEGVADFQLAGVPTGQSVDIEIFSSNTADVTGYAKFQDGVWFTLPSANVQVLADRVIITLVDGGVGDDDGIANGIIVDPGGIVRVTQQEQSIDFGALADQAIGEAPQALSAIATSGLAVSFATDSSSCSIDDGVLTLDNVGLCEVTASQAGDANFLPAETVTQTFVIAPPPDQTPPTVTCPAAPSFVLNDSTASISVSVTDSGSGVASPSISIAVPTNNVGLISVPVDAVDLAGNQTSTTCDVQIDYAISNFGWPLDQNRTNSWRAGTPLLIFWDIEDANGVGVSDNSASPDITSQQFSCNSDVAITEVEVASGYGPGHVYDGIWAYIFTSTRSQRGCYEIAANFNSGQTETLHIKLVQPAWSWWRYF